jgi:thiol-disulfide isomerase/thioredoxin
MNTKQGFGVVGILIVASVVVILGVIAYTQLRSTPETEVLVVTPLATALPTPNVSVPVSSSPVSVDTYSGTVLAGNQTKLLDFTKADYEKALASNKLIVLYFYADWCPICQAEFPKMQAAFDQLQQPNVIGFRVNFNDSATDDVEKALASEHGVAYQHTKVFVKNKQRILKSPETWDTARYVSEITRLAL